MCINYIYIYMVSGYCCAFVNCLINVYGVHSQCFDSSQFLFTKSQVKEIHLMGCFNRKAWTHKNPRNQWWRSVGFPVGVANKWGIWTNRHTSVWLVYRTSLNIKQVFIINWAPANGRHPCNISKPLLLMEITRDSLESEDQEPLGGGCGARGAPKP